MRSDSFRPDIEGLRALAIGLVLAYHTGANLGRSGFMGVDVFFVISGFLITSVLLAELAATGRVSLPNFWARRARRLLPAAMLALIFASLVTWQLLPLTQRQAFGRDIVAAAGYFVNWELAARSIDYLAEDVGASPVQHYWSLAIEEQFYVLWPILLGTVAWWAHSRRRSWRQAVLVAAVGILSLSFLWAMIATATSPASSYFSTFTRLWELAVGAVVALLAGRLKLLPAMTQRAVGWAGLGLMAIGVITITPYTPWPGPATLLPTVGTAALIVAGLGPAGILQRVLGTRPAVWVGGISYSLYLWHWPMIIAARAAWGDIGVAGSAAVVAAAFVPAWLSRRYVEDPIRQSPQMRRPRVAIPVGAVCSLFAVVAGVLTIASIPSRTTTGGSGATPGASGLGAGASDRPGGTGGPDTTTPGAGALLDAGATVDWAAVDVVDAIVPDPFAATDDIPRAVADGCQVGVDVTQPRICRYGVIPADHLIMLVGDSKAIQWATAFDAIATAAGWELDIVSKSACTFTDAVLSIDGEDYTACSRWNEAVRSEVLARNPDVLVVGGVAAQGSFEGSERSREGLAAGYAHLWRELQAADVPPIVIIDNPAPPSPVYECVAQHPQQLSTCAFSFTERVAVSADATQLAAVAATGARTIDLRAWICPRLDRCPAVIGGVLVYRQGSHLTSTYVGTLTPFLSDAIWRASERQLGIHLAALDPAAQLP